MKPELPLRMGKVPFLAEDVILDDAGVSYIFLFSRGKRANGLVDEQAEVADPLYRYQKIFKERADGKAHDDTQHGAKLKAEQISMMSYQELVRAQFLRVLSECGLQASSFESIDRDEVFVTVSFDRDSEEFRSFAERHKYCLPLRSEVYKDEEGFGNYAGGEPMRDHPFGMPVPAYTEYTDELSPSLEAFQQIDEIRMIEMSLAEWLDTDEMVKQGIAQSCFPAANHEEITSLRRDWADWRMLFKVPDYEHIDDVRNYFGERCAFFFVWFTFYVRMLVPLTVLGIFACLRRLPSLGMSIEWQRYVQIVFGLIIIGWSSIFCKLHTRLEQRVMARWGAHESSATSKKLRHYDPSLENTWKLTATWACVRFFGLVYVLLFVALVTQLNLLRRSARTEILDGGSRDFHLSDYVAILTSGLIYMFSFVWGKLAPRLVKLENYKLESEFEHALVAMVAPLKLFFALYPFLFVAFAKKFVDLTCASTLSEAAYQVYGDDGWPVPLSNSTLGGRASSIVETDLTFLKQWHTKANDNEVCMFGCYPAYCKDAGDHFQCKTSCAFQLERSLLVFFFVQSANALVYVLIPIIFAKYEIHKEMSQRRRRRDTSERRQPYSFLQVQAKSPDYAYQSWGGSFSDDFMELAIGFAVMTCFSVVLPIVALPNFLSNMVEYRLIAYRMTAVTRRPSPRSSEGIGIWKHVFRIISVIAVACNVGLIVMVQFPIRHWEPLHALAAFVLLEHVMLFVRCFISEVIPDVPIDIRRISEFNTALLMKLGRLTMVNNAEAKKMGRERSADMCNIDLQLDPPGSVRQGSSLDLTSFWKSAIGQESESSSDEDSSITARLISDEDRLSYRGMLSTCRADDDVSSCTVSVER
eukprot:TRINITY_DN34035_c0_g1_i1.p1 TRINITY_DN34035_c0_g1~~TRINITY_DN34035_c0_g1_i1.p1  ORF type:complete len:867 (+),score=158.53 TRINITY_DN34035_c0_g1_i1:65-2665(+)